MMSWLDALAQIRIVILLMGAAYAGKMIFIWSVKKSKETSYHDAEWMLLATLVALASIGCAITAVVLLTDPYMWAARFGYVHE